VLALLLAAAAQYLIFQRFLATGLGSDDPVLRRAALISWLKAALAWQVAEIVVAAAWIVPNLLAHSHGFFWLLPVLGLLVGTALPLQLVLVRISRRAQP
jgi:hypothetical protein